MMKFIIAFALLASVVVIGSAEARQNPPYDLWCREQPVAFGGTVQICMAYTLQQCLDSRTGPGESCYLNPRYASLYRR
jgi:hypothetical protein